MNKKNLILAVTFVIVITGILFTIIWLSKVRQSQLQPVIANKIEGQNSITEEQIPKQKVEDSNEMENATQVPERFSGAECYAKNVDGSDNLYELSKDFNLSNSTSKITYTNKEKGMSFEIPYSSNWGNKNCKVEPYTEFIQPSGDIFLEFGIPRAWITSEFNLIISDHRTADDIMAEQKNVGGEPDPNPRKMTIGKNQIVAYGSYGMTTEMIYEVIGTRYNYSFSYIEIDKPSEKTVKELEKIIESVKIID